MEKIPFKVVEKDGVHAVKHEHGAVAVILYSLDDNLLIDKVGIVTENNPHFQSGSYSSIVLGSLEHDDLSMIIRAQTEVKEETGYDVEDKERWGFLGEIYTSKLFYQPIYAYFANVTGLSNETPKGDGSKYEEGISFSMLPLHDALKINDSILQTCFFKLFCKLYKKDLYVTDGTS